jgi:hypothetical protein
MNVEKISALEQIKAMLSRAYNAADKQLCDPFGDKESVASYLLTKIHIVTTEIDAFISEEENTFLKNYSEENHEVEVFPLDYDIPAEALGSRFNPLIHACASEIAEAFGDCWVEVKALKSNSSGPEYSISIQPDEYTPNDIQLKLKSLGYAPAFKKINDYPNSAWIYFDVSYNGIAFELSSTVSSKEPPEFERYSEPATDELPF